MNILACSLKAQLEKAQAKHFQAVQENKELKSQIQKPSETMWKLHSDFEEQSSNCNDLRVKPSEAGKLQEQLNKMEEDLLKQREETLQRAQASHQAWVLMSGKRHSWNFNFTPNLSENSASVFGWYFLFQLCSCAGSGCSSSTGSVLSLAFLTHFYPVVNGNLKFS